ncbi:MAG: hypothetical protein GPJ54_14745 [Candidatus Heimdallarchaeota archaeon]|nr:hypothetical protein [Candidatus Heimdallarchaeota archaeon]
MNTTTHTLFTWSGKVVKGGGRGHGFATLPKEISKKSGFNHGDRIILIISNGIDNENLSVDTFYRVSSRSRGFYIPKEITQNNDLLGNRFHFSAHREEGFKTSISHHKQVIIPYKKLDEFQITDRDIIKLRVETLDGQIVEEPVIVKQLNRSNKQDEFIAVFRNNDVEAGSADAKIQGKLEKLDPKPLHSSENMIYTPNLFPNGHMGKLDDDTGILFKGNHTPIEIPLKFDMNGNTHYMGAYFADGTKRGHAWKMSASTPEQAMYYNSIYNQILPNEKFKYKVTYSKVPSDIRSDTEINKDIKKYWNEKTNNSFTVDKVYIVDAQIESALNRNKYGSLEIRNDKGLVMQFHQKMLDQTMEIIGDSNDKKLLWNFVHGILEGDGYVAGGAKRLGLGISCNIDNYEFIQNILDKLGIQFRTDTFDSDSGRSDGVQIQFGLFEILKNFKDIKDDVFQYYPKRAERLFDRMAVQSTVRHMLGERSQSSFARARANELKSDEITNFFKNRQL